LAADSVISRKPYALVGSAEETLFCIAGQGGGNPPVSLATYFTKGGYCSFREETQISRRSPPTPSSPRQRHRLLHYCLGRWDSRYRQPSEDVTIAPTVYPESNVHSPRRQRRTAPSRALLFPHLHVGVEIWLTITYYIKFTIALTM